MLSLIHAVDTDKTRQDCLVFSCRWCEHSWRQSSTVFTAQSSYASAVLGIVILSVRLSVCLSVRSSVCPSHSLHTDKILRPHERVIGLVF